MLRVAPETWLTFVRQREDKGPENQARKYRNFVYDENQRFIYPTSDWGFKYLLGSEENKDILLELLNRLFPDYHIESLEYCGGGARSLCKFQKQRIFDR